MFENYEICCLCTLACLDLILGYVRSIFITRDFVLKKSIVGVIKKLALIIGVAVIYFSLEIANGFNVTQQAWIDYLTVAYGLIILLACFSEFISVVANLSIITNINFDKIKIIEDNIKKKEEE